MDIGHWSVMNTNDIGFIISCVQNGRVFWTYHSSMRLAGRNISRETILRYIQDIEVIETYGDDFPLPSCLCLLRGEKNTAIHIVIAIDKAANNIRIVTVYKPGVAQWSEDFRERKQK